MNGRRGTAAGVPYIAAEPETSAGAGRLVAVLHLMDPPRSEAAMAAALPLAGVDAWRVYLGLPMFGARAPAGGLEEIMRLAFDEPLLKLIAPVIEQAAAELPSAIDALRSELGIAEGPLALAGGSAGGAAVMLALAESELPVAAAAFLNPATRMEAVMEAGERAYGTAYNWTPEGRDRAARIDFVRRAPEIATRRPGTPLLFVVGQEDDPAFIAASREMHDALRPSYSRPDDLAFVSIAGLGHALAEEPGLEAAPQTPGAVAVDATVSSWLNRYLRS